MDHAAEKDKTLFGFWVYIMTDCILFASLFAVYAILQNNTFGGPSGKELFSLPYVLVETGLLLISSYTCGIAMLAVQAGNKNKAADWLRITFLLGSLFLVMEVAEFRHLVQEGHSWRESGFLSAFFVLVGTHGLHIIAGLIWLGVMFRKIAKQGLTSNNVRRLTMFSMFWHFLDIVWIFLFSVVYLLGAA